MNTTPPSDVRLKTHQTPKYHIRWTPFTHARTHRYGYRYHHGGNCCGLSLWADRACGPDPTGTCCCRASSEDHVVFFRVLPAYRYRYWYWHSCGVQTPAAAPESPATTTPTSGETMLPGESHEWLDNESCCHTPSLSHP